MSAFFWRNGYAPLEMSGESHICAPLGKKWLAAGLCISGKEFVENIFAAGLFERLRDKRLKENAPGGRSRTGFIVGRFRWIVA